MWKRGVNIGSALIWEPTGGSEWPWIIGTDNTHPSYPAQILHYDLEVSFYPSGEMGHLTVLGLPNLQDKGPCFCDYKTGMCEQNSTCDIEQLYESTTGLTIADWAQTPEANPPEDPDRVVFGVNHTQVWQFYQEVPFGYYASEIPVHVFDGNVSFLAVEIAEPERAGQPATGPIPRTSFQLWSDLLNSDYQVALAGGSDNRCIQKQIGMMRTRFLTDAGPLTYDKYLDALRQGRTVVVAGKRTNPWCTDGSCDDWADLTIQEGNGIPVRVGGTLDYSGPEDLDFTITANLLEAGEIELLIDGDVVQTWQVSAGQHTRTYLDSDSQDSYWAAVRTPRAQTSPIYVTENGARIGNISAACRMAARVHNLIAANPAAPPFAQTRYTNAKNKYLSLAGGVAHCDVNNPPSWPAPTQPPNDELNEPGQDYPDSFWGKQLSASASIQRKTGTLASLNDQDWFYIGTSCPAGKNYMRARVALRTEARLDLARYNLYYCWSDGGIRCSVGGIVHTERRELAPVGGGTSANVPLDVPCSPGKARWLSIQVWTPGGGTVSCSVVYSLFYSVVGVDDGFT
ncbi:MAG: hypothetical protein MJD61_02780, partial [Proteobacteria bacterium]|nr:hypothetical protein [Pseudomonadota bacterium]